MHFHVFHQLARTIAKSLEGEQERAEGQKHGQKLVGMEIARQLAIAIGGSEPGDELVESAKAGLDVRAAVLRKIAWNIGISLDFHTVDFVREGTYDAHSSPDEHALKIQRLFTVAAPLYIDTLPIDHSCVHLLTTRPEIVRLNPRIRPRTAVLLKLSLPGMHEMCFAWNAER